MIISIVIFFVGSVLTTVISRNVLRIEYKEEVGFARQVANQTLYMMWGVMLYRIIQWGSYGY